MFWCQYWCMLSSYCNNKICRKLKKMHPIKKNNRPWIAQKRAIDKHWDLESEMCFYELINNPLLLVKYCVRTIFLPWIIPPDSCAVSGDPTDYPWLAVLWRKSLLDIHRATHMNANHPSLAVIFYNVVVREIHFHKICIFYGTRFFDIWHNQVQSVKRVNHTN